MDYRKRLKTRLYTAIVYVIIGLALIAVNFFAKEIHESISSFGAVFLVVGIARIVQYFRIIKNEEILHSCEIKETDERNVMIWTKARSMAVSIYVVVAAIAIIVLYWMKMDYAAMIIAYTLLGFLIIYWVCYFIMSRKY